jgi:hypothetical protein
VDVGGLSPICRPLLVSMKTQSLRLVLEHRKELMTIWRWCSSKFFHQFDLEAIRAMVSAARITRDIEELRAKIRAGADRGVEQQASRVAYAAVVGAPGGGAGEALVARALKNCAAPAHTRRGPRRRKERIWAPSSTAPEAYSGRRCGPAARRVR